MSTQITEAFARKFSGDVYHLAQQRMSTLRGAVRVESIIGADRAAFDRIGLTSLSEMVNRHSDTPQVDTPHTRRWVVPAKYHTADLIDDVDRVKVMMDPASAYAESMARAAGRTMDEIIIAAMAGSAITGETGTGTTAYDTNMTVDVQVGSGGSDVGLNIEKLIAAKKLLDQNEVESNDRYISLNAQQLSNLMAETTVTSADYNTVRALVSGELDTYLGFKFIRNELNGVDANDDHRVWFWQKSGVVLGLSQDMDIKVTDRPDKNHSTQVYVSLIAGAVRMEEEKVGFIECDPTAAG